MRLSEIEAISLRLPGYRFVVQSAVDLLDDDVDADFVEFHNDFMTDAPVEAVLQLLPPDAVFWGKDVKDASLNCFGTPY